MDFRLVDKTIVSPDLMRLADYCEALDGGGAMPPARAFALSELHWLFGFVVTADVIDGGRDYRYSYSGEFWKVALNYDLTSQRLSELEAVGRLMNFREHYDKVIANCAPRYRTARMTWPDGKIVRYERLVVPFADDNGEPIMLLIAARSDKSIAELLEYKATGEPRLELELTKQAKVA